MDEVIHSTPVPIEISEDNELMKMMQLLFNEQSVKLNKFDEKFDEVKDEIKKQNFNFNKQINEMNACYENMQEQIIEVVSQKFDKQNARVDDNCEIKWG